MPTEKTPPAGLVGGERRLSASIVIPARKGHASTRVKDDDEMDDQEDDAKPKGLDPFRPTASDMMSINKLTLRDFAADELWVVTIRACDNQPDRHFERLKPAALKKLGDTYVGRPGLIDHAWSAKTQTSRVFNAQVKRDSEEPSAVASEQYNALYLKQYMVRKPENEAFRADIEAGILKETSVGFFLDYKSVKCSICGEAIYDWMGDCDHFPGAVYDEVMCLGEIPAHAALEAAENSWVAVPAQPKAGAVRTAKAADAPAAGSDGADPRRDLLKRKEAALDAKRLHELLTNGDALKAALEGQDPALVDSIKAALATVKSETAPEVPPLPPEPEAPTPEAAPEAPPAEAKTPAAEAPEALESGKSALSDSVDFKSVGAREVISAALEPFATKAIALETEIAALKSSISALTALVSSKFAPVGEPPLTVGFAKSAEAEKNAVSNAARPSGADSIGASLVSSLLA